MDWLEHRQKTDMDNVLAKIVEEGRRDLRQEYDAKLAEKDRSLVEMRQSLEETVRENAQMKAFIQSHGLIYGA